MPSITSLLLDVASAPPAMPETMLRSRLAGRYSIERLLGEGGMGAVYLAREVEADRPVALKVIRSDLAADARYRERLVEEARIAAGLSHPNVVPVHRLDEVDGVLLMVMAFVEGSSLRERMRTHTFSAREAMGIVRDVAWALAAAHAAGVVHRDVKPDNILLERSSGRVVVADFGIAARDGGKNRGGTDAYMSPEQAHNLVVDARSDLYSLGVTAWELFTGLVPRFPLNQPLTGVPAPVVELVMRLIAADPRARPASASEVAATLTALIEGARLPPELRAWAEGDRSIDAGFFALLVPTVAVAVGLQGPWLAAPGIAVLYEAVRRSLRFRALLRSGTTRDDLRGALVARLDELRPPPEPNSVERMRGLKETRNIAAGVALAMLPPALLIEALTHSVGAGPVLMAIVGSLGFIVAGVASVIVGLREPARSTPWRDVVSLRVRGWFWSTVVGDLSVAALRGSAGPPSSPRIERRLAAATTSLVLRSADHKDLVPIVRALENRAMRSRADDDGKLGEAVMHLERIKLAIETNDGVADHTRAARRFLEG